MLNPARFRSRSRQALLRAQSYNRWLLYVAGAVLLLVAKRCATHVEQVTPAEVPGVLTIHCPPVTLPV